MSQGTSLARYMAFLLGLVVALEAGYWALSWPQSPVNQEPVAAAGLPGPVSAAMLATWLDRGGPAPANVVAEPYRLLGVVSGVALRGSAVIAAAGGHPRSVRVGDPVDDHWILQSVSARQAVLMPRAGGRTEAMTLNLDLKGIARTQADSVRESPAQSRRRPVRTPQRAGPEP